MGSIKATKINFITGANDTGQSLATYEGYANAGGYQGPSSGDIKETFDFIKWIGGGDKNTTPTPFQTNTNPNVGNVLPEASWSLGKKFAVAGGVLAGATLLTLGIVYFVNRNRS